MAYYSDNWTDKELEALERRIAEVFKEAEKDLDKEVKEYFGKFKLRDKEMKDLVDAGEMTEAAYQQWRLTQIGRGQRFEALRDKVAERYTQANEVANAYVNDLTPSIYSLNRNYEAYTIEKAVGNCDFTLWDESTVRRLLVEQPDLMPYYPPSRALNRGIDLEYGKSQITKHVTSGIIRGLAPGKIANELMTSVTGMNRDSAVRAARTGVTTAQNAGRFDSYIAAEKMGIQIKRRWACTKDARTRFSHGMADGQIVVGTKEPFKVGGYKMMFPGDRSLGAPGHEIYNCRCTTRTVEKDGIEAEPRQMRVRDPVTGETELISEMTYQEWYNWKRGQDPNAFDIAQKKIKNASSDRAQYEKYRDQLGNSVGKTFADFQEMKYNRVDEYNLLKQYARDVRTGWVSPLSGFTNYKDLHNRIQTEIVGKTAANGTVITGQVPHFMQRVIGTMVDPQKLKDELKVIRRSGVDVDSIVEAVFRPVEIGSVQVRKSGKRSVKLIGEKCVVTINPDTGELIQTNPL